MSREPESIGSKTSRRISYGNFADPFGLIWRMLSEGGRIGLSTLTIEAISKIVKPLDWALQGREQRLRESAPKSEQPIVLIVGPPRSGTTLIYQVLAKHWDVSYFTNRNAMFPRSPVSAAKLFEKSFVPPDGNYNSLYGNTSGLAGPNDGFHIWNEFFGEDRYEIPDQLPESLQISMQQLFNAWAKITQKPMLNKNNRNTVCMAALADCLPMAKFIIIERHPWFVAQSLIQARKWVQGSKKLGWGLGAETVQGKVDSLDYVDSVCHQVSKYHLQLQNQIARIDPQRVFQTSYEAFCERPAQFVQEASAWLPAIPKRDGESSESLRPFRVSDSWKLAEEIVERIQLRLPEPSVSNTASSSPLSGPNFGRSSHADSQKRASL
ncbi:sulfotransferase [Adhaeretor mobilis]|uniref:Sulfotransferase n=1 Tax=Adhaeretor mobilis TaxID=1930276 RepID=A0A517MVV4_9BACT|nr:sulfotransferase [Adhaeretor mobilis]QDS99008.1 hypothetical protein HG15A2_22970 [Adhaeretor mobilis]